MHMEESRGRFQRTVCVVGFYITQDGVNMVGGREACQRHVVLEVID